MATLNDALVAGIDFLRTVGDSDPLERAMLRYIASLAKDFDISELNVARNDALRGIVRLIADHVITPQVAAQAPIIMRRKVLDLRRSRTRATGNWVPPERAEENIHQLDRDAVHRHFESSDLLTRALAALPLLERDYPRYFAAIQAHFNGLNVAEHLSARFGKTSRAAADQLTHRARKKLLSYMDEEAS